MDLHRNLPCLNPDHCQAEWYWGKVGSLYQYSTIPRKKNILDILFTNNPSFATAVSDIPGISDHNRIALADIICHPRRNRPADEQIWWHTNKWPLGNVFLYHWIWEVLISQLMISPFWFRFRYPKVNPIIKTIQSYWPWWYQSKISYRICYWNLASTGIDIQRFIKTRWSTKRMETCSHRTSIQR